MRHASLEFFGVGGENAANLPASLNFVFFNHGIYVGHIQSYKTNTNV